MQEHRDRMKAEPIVDRHPGHVRVARKGQDDAVKWLLRFWVVLGVALLSLACFTAGWGEDGRESKTVPDPRLGVPESVAASCAGADLSGLQTAIYVSPQGTDSADCGASPSTACKTLQQGINNCSATGCGVLVRHGLYPTSETIELRDGVSVYGSCVFDGETDRKYRTVVQAVAGWSFAGDTGVSGNGSGFTSGNPSAPEGRQVAFIQHGSSSVISQSIFVSQAGQVQVRLQAAQRANCCGQGGSAQDFEVLLGTTSLGVYSPAGTSYEEVTTAPLSVTPGTYALKLVGRDSAGGDNTVFIDNVRVQVGSTALDVANFGFEQPPVGDGVFQYNPTTLVTGWSFAGDTGVSGNGSGFTSNQTAPEGVQVAFIQHGSSDGISSVISQLISVTQAGQVQVRLQAAQRGNCCGQGGSAQDFEVLLDTTSLGVYQPAGPSYEAVTPPPLSVTAGMHTLKLVGKNSAGGDNTVFIDNVRVQVGSTALDVANFGFEQPPVGDGAFQYNPPTWVSGIPVLSGSAINTATTVYGLVVIGQDETTNSTASIAMTVSNSTGLTLSHTVLASGKGGDGAPGQSASAPGGVGGNASQQDGGAVCGGRPGDPGSGGNGGTAETPYNCEGGTCCLHGDPQSGFSNGSVSGGGPGGQGSNGLICADRPSDSPNPGGPAGSGGAGQCGGQALASPLVTGSFDKTAWIPSKGGDGPAGTAGAGGGGGGAGGSCGDAVEQYTGGWGGGGGGGGCGGGHGNGGQQGGASIPLVLFDSTLTLDQLSIIPSPGGRGGDGGNGAAGGTGGAGAAGQSVSQTLFFAHWCPEGGGAGGNGGFGGAGSGGAGGNGGPSFGIALVGASPVPAAQSGMYAGLPGAGGAKGMGAQNPSDPNFDPTPCKGADGQDGVAGGTAAIGPNTMIVNEELTPGQSRTSSDGRYLFMLQTDGDLCLYGPAGSSLWCTNTAGQNTQTAIMQADGNFCLYNQEGGYVFCTFTVTYPEAYLTVQDDGHVVIYSGTTQLWTRP